MASEFDILRERAKREGNAFSQQNMEAIKRRQAAIGNLNSGAAIKQQRQAATEAGRVTQDALSNVDVLELQDKKRQDEIQKNREFVTSERLGSQTFASGEREASQGFASGERQAGQTFASTESQKGRDFSKELFNKEFGLKERQQGFAEETTNKQLGFQERELQENIRNNFLSLLLQFGGDDLDFNSVKARDSLGFLQSQLGINLRQDANGNFFI